MSKELKEYISDAMILDFALELLLGIIVFGTLVTGFFSENTSLSEAFQIIFVVFMFMLALFIGFFILLFTYFIADRYLKKSLS